MVISMMPIYSMIKLVSTSIPYYSNCSPYPYQDYFQWLSMIGDTMVVPIGVVPMQMIMMNCLMITITMKVVTMSMIILLVLFPEIPSRCDHYYFSLCSFWLGYFNWYWHWCRIVLIKVNICLNITIFPIKRFLW